MKTLAENIERQFLGESNEWGICAVCEEDLQRIWPSGDKDREAKMEQFAKENGFRLRYYSKGLCAIFEKAPPPS